MREHSIENSTVYLAGPIDGVRDDGIQWRREFRRLCDDKGLKFNVFDPTDKPYDLQGEIGEEKHYISQLKEEGRLKEAQDRVKKIRRVDLRMVDKADFIVVYVDINIHMCGTYFECCFANIEKKPILCIVKQGRRYIPSFLLSYVFVEEIFDNVEQCVCYLDKLYNNGKTLDERWVQLF